MNLNSPAATSRASSPHPGRGPIGAIVASVATFVGTWLLFSLLPGSTGSQEKAESTVKAVLVIHGGAGTRAKEEMPPELEKRYRADLERALREGHKALIRGTSLDAVEVAIKVLEDSPLFNAGKGAVFTSEGRNELDASIMEGKDKRAGAVAAVRRIKNPISAARAVMEKTAHVLLVGDGADRFAVSVGLEEANPLYFWTEERWNQLLKARREQKDKSKGSGKPPLEGDHGTVGAVAIDGQGNLAAGTSTGGMTNRLSGRVGDSPIIGAGTYADNETCAVSATGHGEYFIRHAVAHDIVALMRYKGISVDKAAGRVIHETLKKAGGEGGVIALDAQGNFTMPFNSEGMYRGYITRDGTARVFVYDR
jgi:beta-aspartyl-peptidase (threonine type)